MAGSSLGILRGREGELTADSLARAKAEQQLELSRARLVPDWFTGSGGLLCLPPGMRVAVIGGGFAGMAAAWYLNACGVRVTVYEAAARLGGRVHTDHAFIKGKLVEAGAELIGNNHPLWWRLRKDFGLTLDLLTQDEEYEEKKKLIVRYRFGGHTLTEPEKEKLRDDLRGVLAKIGSDAKAIDPRRPWLSPDAKKYDDMSVADKVNELEKVGPLGHVRSWFEFTIPNDNCAKLSKQSYLGLLTLVRAGRMGSTDTDLLGYWEHTETHRCREGNQALADSIAAKLSDVRVNAPVKSVTITVPRIPPVKIQAGDFSEEYYDFVVLTLPPSSWESITFNPPFDAARRTISHGPSQKFLASYPTEFWLAKALAPSTKSDDIGSIWESTDRQEAKPGGFGLTAYSGGPLVLPENECKQGLANWYPGQPPTTTGFHPATYAIPEPGQVRKIMPQLIEPEGRMYFAGEQTSSGYFGYMEGALQSGARAARDIVWKCKYLCRGVVA
jgi:monoamine oxidase